MGGIDKKSRRLSRIVKLNSKKEIEKKKRINNRIIPWLFLLVFIFLFLKNGEYFTKTNIKIRLLRVIMRRLTRIDSSGSSMST